MIVSFDFDFTLSLMDGSLNRETEKLFRECVENQDEILIITSRDFSEKSENEIRNFLIRHNLPVKSIIHSNGPKVNKIIELGVEKHFDDDKQEIEICKEHGIEVVNCFNRDLFVEQWIMEFGEEPLEIVE